MVTLQLVKSLTFGELGFGELAANSNSPIFSAIKLWGVSLN